jgi:dephospho-CoA kinase
VTGRLRLIGLTGGIGSGKSAVARLIAARGIPVIDADQLAREVVATPRSPALLEIAAIWPDVIDPQGQLDRRKLAARVFGNPAARTKLEAIMHPRIGELSNQRAAELAQAGHRLAFYEASLLVETGRHADLDGLVVVDAPEELRMTRVVSRDNATPTEVRARIAAQLPVQAKRQVATYVIENDGDMTALSERVDAMLKILAVSAPST